MHIGHPRAVLFNVFMVRNGIAEINSRIRQIIPQMNMHGCLIHSEMIKNHYNIEIIVITKTNNVLN